MMQALVARPLAIPEVLEIRPKRIGDARGYFMEVWHAQEFARVGIDAAFVQVNQSGSRRGILRGLHYQVVKPQGKLVRVLSGRIFDVAVDLRRSAATFGKWVGVTLDGNEHNQLWVPPGFAHGFYVQSEMADVEYCCTEVYAPEYDRTIAWDDPDIGVRWPLDQGNTPMLSEKDSHGTAFRHAELFE